MIRLLAVRQKSCESESSPLRWGIESACNRLDCGRASPVPTTTRKESRMKTALWLALISAMCMAQTADLKPSVTYAKSWEAAVAEAKLLNLPIVVHSHGFY